MRVIHLLTLLPALLLGQPSAWAQTPDAAAPAKAGSRLDQRIEHIQIEDKDVHIDERRFGGETQSITVQPTNGLPAYEVVPANGARNRPLGERDAAPGNSGQRVWKLFNF